MIKKKNILLFTLLSALVLFQHGTFRADSIKKLRVATIDDLMEIKNIQDVQIAPDGSQVLYVISGVDLEGNFYNSDN
jgi:hypothetical protein